MPYHSMSLGSSRSRGLLHAEIADDVRVAFCNYRPGETMRRETCPDGQLWLNLSGTWTVRKNGRPELEIGPRTVQFYARGTKNERETRGVRSSMIGLQVAAPTSWLADFDTDRFSSSPRAIWAYLEAVELSIRQAPGWESGMSEAAKRVVRAFGEPKPLVPQWLQDVKRELRAVPTPRFEDIAARMGVSASYLSTVFHRTFGMTMTDYVKRIRRYRALLLMADPDARLGEIAAQVGYFDQAHFSRSFKSGLGITPSEFRDLLGVTSH